MKTYNDIYLDTRRKLRAAGISAHDLEARLIISYVTGKSREELLRSSRLFVTDDAILRTAEEMVRRRLEGEPIAYIVGEWEFFGLPIRVSEAVLIPRIDTEVFALEAIKLVKGQGQTRLLDLCAGSGCIGLAVAANVPDCRVLLADNSAQAIKICRANILKNRLTRNVTAIEADALENPPSLLGSFDVVVSNPPYIPACDIIGLDPSVRDYEPLDALDGGPDGLMFYRAIASKWRILLREGGHMAFECGIGQSERVRAIMEENGFADLRTYIDTLGIERVVIGTKDPA